MRHWPVFVMVTLLIFSAVLLIPTLDHPPLWVDEGWTVWATDAPNLAEVTERVNEDVHPPLYFYALYGWRQITGDTVFEMRYFTVLTTLLAVAMVYRLGRTLLNVQTGLIAALLYTLQDLVQVLSQEIRQYPMQQLLAALTLWAYWRFWRWPNRKNGVIFAVAGSALLWTHYWGGFVLLALAIHALLTCGLCRKLLPFVLANGAIGLSYLLWLPVLYRQMTQEISGGLGHALPNSWDSYKVLAFQLLGRPELFWLILLAVAIIPMIFRAPSAKKPLVHPVIVPILVTLVAVGLTVAINADYAILSFRALSVILPVLAVIFAYALMQFRSYERAVVVLFIVAQALTTTSADHPLHLPWPEITGFVAEHTTDDEIALIESNFDAYAQFYYFDQHGTAYLPTELRRHEHEADFQAWLGQELADTEGVWVVQHNAPYRDIRPELAQLGYLQTAVLTWDPNPNWSVELWRFDRLPQTEPRAVFDENLQLTRATASTFEDGVTINLLWSPITKPERNYTTSVFLLNEGGQRACEMGCGHDSYPFENRAPTLNWNPGGYYFDGHVLHPENLPPGRYRVGVKVYTFTDTNFTQLQIAPASDCSANPACEYIIIDTVEIN